MTNVETFLDVSQVARMLGLSRATIRKWVLTGFIPCKKIGRAVRFSASEIQGWAESKSKGKAQSEKEGGAANVNESNTRTTTGTFIPACIAKGRRGMGAKMVVVASDSRDVQNWLYRYLEPYGLKGYAFYLVESEEVFSEYVGKIDTVMAFVEDIFFGERTVGMLGNIRKQYPKLKLALFSASVLPLGLATRYLYWSMGSYLSLRDSEKEIREAVEAIFGKRLAVPSYLIGCLDEYGRLSDRKPHLTHREVEIVRCTGEGKTGKETASVLMLSRRTVQNHISNIYQKFGIRNMVGVLKLAVSKGILPVEELMSFRD